MEAHTLKSGGAESQYTLNISAAFYYGVFIIFY